MLIRHLPEEIKQKALNEQVRSGNPRNEDIDVNALAILGGFYWGGSEDGSSYWLHVSNLEEDFLNACSIEDDQITY